MGQLPDVGPAAMDASERLLLSELGLGLGLGLSEQGVTPSTPTPTLQP